MRYKMSFQSCADHWEDIFRCNTLFHFYMLSFLVYHFVFHFLTAYQKVRLVSKYCWCQNGYVCIYVYLCKSSLTCWAMSYALMLVVKHSKSVTPTYLAHYFQQKISLSPRQACMHNVWQQISSVEKKKIGLMLLRTSCFRLLHLINQKQQ